MTKSKAQLRAEAVERLKNSVGARFKPDAAVIAIVGGRIGLADWSLECDKLIDLLTDDCGPCYSCAKLAELRAENNALHVKLDGQERADVSQAVEDTAERVTNKGEMLDSREKLEADIRKYRNEHCETSGRVAEWLDRQAAITKREREQHWLEIVGASANCNLELTNQIAELREDVAERDDVIAVLKAENAELQSRHCEWSDPDSLGDGCMLRKDKRVDELTAERDQWREAAGNAHDMWEEADAERNELRREVDRLTRENISLARDLGECMAERDGLKRENAKLSDDELYLRCTLVDMDGEVVG